MLRCSSSPLVDTRLFGLFMYQANLAPRIKFICYIVVHKVDGLELQEDAEKHSTFTWEHLMVADHGRADRDRGVLVRRFGRFCGESHRWSVENHSPTASDRHHSCIDPTFQGPTVTFEWSCKGSHIREAARYHIGYILQSSGSGILPSSGTAVSFLMKLAPILR